MNLVDYQRDSVQQIYEFLMEKSGDAYINLYGNHGSGKSTIALGITETLLEGWQVFYIDGVDTNLSPYLTWHIGTKLFSKRKLNFSGSISFGVEKFFLSTVDVAFPKIDKINYILNSNEEALWESIKKQAGGTTNILFIADNYELWDIPSAQFLQKLLMPSLNLLNGYKVSLLLISSEQLDENMWNLSWRTISIPTISDDNMLAVLHQRGYKHVLNMADIRACAGNDLSLALMVAQYYDGNKMQMSTFKEIMDRRLSGLPQQDQEAIRILEPISIIDTCFSNEEMAYFIDNSSYEDADVLLMADEYIEKAVENNLIIGQESYHFANRTFKDYFKEKLAKREKYLHKKFADYLKYRHPEDYFSRGKHLKASIQNSHDLSGCEAWQLLLLAFVRWTVTLGQEPGSYNILSEIDEIVDSACSDIQKTAYETFLEGYYAFTECNYRKALYCLQTINQSILMQALRAECQRLIVLCLVQLADNAHALREATGELYDLIEDKNFNEDEQYCRAALVILEVYLDRQIDSAKVEILKGKLKKTISRHQFSADFLEINACLNRKSALFYSALIACELTEQSIRFYRDYNNKSGLYMALCNHAANAIICKKYAAAEKALLECQCLVNSENKRYYPSQYKVENNAILLKYLQEENENLKNRRLLITSAKKALKVMKQISTLQKDEVSYVIYLNYLSLSILCNVRGADEELKQAEHKMADVDVFYQYYLHDLMYASALLQKNINVAKEELNIIKNMDVPLLHEYNRIFAKRREVQESLLDDPELLDGDAVKYHRLLIEKCAHIQDDSCYFYGRGFLLSDLQFLSF